MRTLLLTIVPAIAMMAAPAFAQSSATSETTTVTTGAAPAPVPAQTTTQKEYKSEAGPNGQAMEAKTKSVTTDAYGNKSAEKNHASGTDER